MKIKISEPKLRYFHRGFYLLTLRVIITGELPVDATNIYKLRIAQCGQINPFVYIFPSFLIVPE